VYICGELFHKCFTKFMATFKATVEKHHRKKDGTYNVKIRVTHRRVVRYLATQLYVTGDDLTKSMRIKNRAVTDVLEDTVRRYRNLCNGLGERLEVMTTDQVIAYLKKAGCDPVFHLDFLAFGEEVIATMRKNGRKGTAGSYAVALRAVRRFTGSESLDISGITAAFLEDFVAWLRDHPAGKSWKHGCRAQSLYTSCIRSLHNLAKRRYNDEESGKILIPQSPFRVFKIPRDPPTRKRALPVDALRAIAALPYRKSVTPGENRYNLAKDVFLLSFGLVGMNTVDLYGCNRLEEGRIIYRRQKVSGRRADGAEISIRIEPEMLPLVEKYRDLSGERVFRFYRMYADATGFNRAVNAGLKKIGAELGLEDLEFYSARHSWATVAVNTAGVDKYTVHEALNHAMQEMKVTDIYIKKDGSRIDAANRKTLDCAALGIG
jgi:integrase